MNEIIDIEYFEKKVGESLKENSSSSNFKLGYDEFHNFLLENGVRDKGPQDYIYKKNLSPVDKMLFRLIGNNKKVLEMGVGDGLFSIFCAKNRNDVIGVDISSVALKLANAKKMNNLKIEFIEGDGRRLSFHENTFDFIISKDVIEHFPEKDLDNHLNTVYNVLKANGSYILCTPSKLMGESSFGMHFKEYGLTELIPKLQSKKFKVEVILIRYSLFGPILKISNNSLINLLIIYEKLLDKIKIIKLIGKKSIYLGYFLVPPICLKAVKMGE